MIYLCSVINWYYGESHFYMQGFTIFTYLKDDEYVKEGFNIPRGVIREMYGYHRDINKYGNYKFLNINRMRHRKKMYLEIIHMFVFSHLINELV